MTRPRRSQQHHSTTFTRDWRVKIGTLAMALAIVVAAGTVQPAQAAEYEHHGRHWQAQEQRHYRHGHGHYYAPAPYVYYAPPPIVYAPPPPPGGFLTFIFPFTIH